jgi:hypothetical protein
MYLQYLKTSLTTQKFIMNVPLVGTASVCWTIISGSGQTHPRFSKENLDPGRFKLTQVEHRGAIFIYDELFPDRISDFQQAMSYYKLISDFYKYVRNFFVSITLSTTLERIVDGFIMKGNFPQLF